MKKTGFSSGYTNTDKIGNEDLFPNEGYAFPPMQRTKQTRNYGSSTLFPLNQRINSEALTITSQNLKTRLEGQRPPSPFQDIPLPQGIRQGRRKLIKESTLKVRAQQVAYNQKMRDYNAKQGDSNALLEQEEMRLLKAELETEQAQKKRERHELAESYQNQLKSIELRKQKEREETKEFEEMLKKKEEQMAAEDAIKQEKLLQIRKERREEYNAKYAEMLAARQRRIENEKAEEKRLQLESAEIEKRREERAAEDERRRVEKTRIRARVCDEQAKSLAMLQSKHETEQIAAESATAKAAEEQMKKQEEKHKQMQKERHSEWLNLQKEREAKRRSSVKQPFPRKVSDVDPDKVAEEKRRQENIFYRSCQLKQMEERRAREQREKEQELEDDKKMLASTQAKFTVQLNRLKELVPPELGIEVPEYSETK